MTKISGLSTEEFCSPALFPGELSVKTDGGWDFTGDNTRYLTHNLHPYLASMIPQIPRKLLSLYARPGMKVLDPFVGGGSVVVEAYLAGLESAGFDVNPLAVIISKAKTTPIPQRILASAMVTFREAYRRAKPTEIEFEPTSRVAFWFKPYTFEPLSRIRAAMREVVGNIGRDAQDSLGNLFACIFSNTVRDISLTYRGEVRLRRLQGDDLERFNPNVLVEFEKRMKDAFLRVAELPRRSASPLLCEGDVRHMSFEDGEYDLVVTSPPYGDIKNTIPYHQFSKNMLYWLGLGDVAVDKIRRSSLGAKNGQKNSPPSRTLQSTLSGMKTPNLKHEAVCFYSDYEEALREIARVTSQRVVIVIGHRILDGLVIDNARITTEFMEEIGWKLETRFERKIRKKRIHSKMGFGNNARGGTIDAEAILVYVPRD